MENPGDYDIDKDIGDLDPDENTIGAYNITQSAIIFHFIEII